MSAEHAHSEIQRFYIQERLPQLQELIEAFWDGTNMLPRESIEGIVAEFNQGLSLVHIQKAPHMPHYRVVSNGKGDLGIEQYIPALQKEVPRKQPRNEVQLITPTVTKIADSEHPYPFSLDFLTPHLDDLADAIQQETIDVEAEYETDHQQENEASRQSKQP